MIGVGARWATTPAGGRARGGSGTAAASAARATAAAMPSARSFGERGRRGGGGRPAEGFVTSRVLNRATALCGAQGRILCGARRGGV